MSNKILNIRYFTFKIINTYLKAYILYIQKREDDFMWHNKSSEEVERSLKTNTKNGQKAIKDNRGLLF